MAGVLPPCKFLLLSPLTGFFTVVFRRRVVCPLALVGQWADEIEKMTNLKALKHQGTSRTAGKNNIFVFVLNIAFVNLLFYIDHKVLEKYHVVVTTYDTVKSEYDSYNPSAKNESKKSKASSKKKNSDSDSDDSESDSKITKKSKGAKKCALFNVKWWRSVLGAIF